MALDPSTPVIVGCAQRNVTEIGSEPIDLMATVTRAALADAGGDLADRVDSIRVVLGIWPYKDPGTLLAEELGWSDSGRQLRTAMTQFGGNEVYDLLAETVSDVAAGVTDVAVIASAETMRTRRADQKAGRRTEYRAELTDAAPDMVFGSDRDFASATETAAGMGLPLNYYATAENALRHELGEDGDTHKQRIAALWERASKVATGNRYAALGSGVSARAIAEAGSTNRPVAHPYNKLMTANVNVDQGAAVIVCSVEAAQAAGVPRDRWVFPWASTSAVDSWSMTRRRHLHRSPGMAAAGKLAASNAGRAVDEFDLLDIYSCFPVAVQIAQREVGFDPAADFTITGGLTFAGGPLNSYCMHALATAVGKLRHLDDGAALLTGLGGLLTKHSYATLGSRPPDGVFSFERVNSGSELSDQRPASNGLPESGTIESFTVEYAHDSPGRAIVAVLAADESRVWATSTSVSMVADMVAGDPIGQRVSLTEGSDGVADLEF